MAHYSTIYDENNNLWVCGFGKYGELGINPYYIYIYQVGMIEYNREKTNSFQILMNDPNIIAIEHAIKRMFIIKKNKNTYELWACGESRYCNIKISFNMYFRVPKLILTSNNHISIKCGLSHNLMLETDKFGHKKVYGFSDNSYGQLGNENYKHIYKPKLIMEDSKDIKIISINCNHDSSIIITYNLKDNTKEIWMYGYYYQKNEDENNPMMTYFDYRLKSNNIVIPKLLLKDSLIKQVACANNYSVILKDNGQVWRTPMNNTHTKFDNKLIFIMHDEKIESIACGAVHTLVLKKKCVDEYNKNIHDEVWGFGSNESGQLGVTSIQQFNEPLLIIIAEKIKKIHCGILHSMVLAKNVLNHDNLVNFDDKLKLYVFGYNEYGQLGLGDNNSRYTPVISKFDGEINMLNGERKFKCCPDNYKFFAPDVQNRIVNLLSVLKRIKIRVPKFVLFIIFRKI